MWPPLGDTLQSYLVADLKGLPLKKEASFKGSQTGTPQIAVRFWRPGIHVAKFISYATLLSLRERSSGVTGSSCVLANWTEVI